MKSVFWKTFFAVLLALVVGWILKLIFWGSVIGVIASSSNATVPVQDHSVLVVDMSTFVLDEQTTESFAGASLLSGDALPTVGILDAIQTIYAAASDPRISCIYLRPDGATAGYAQIEELRAALKYFRDQGKPVVAYTLNPDNAGYYLATVADKLYMTSDHGGTSMLVGLGGQMMFLGDILERLGVNVQLIRHGKYKSAGEMFVRNSSSPENREQNQRMITSMWESLRAPISESRGISQEALDEMIDGLELVQPEDFLEKGLVDALLDKAGVAGKLAVVSGVSGADDLRLIALQDYVESVRAVPSKRKNTIAVVFLNGEIVDGAGSSLSLDGGVTGDYFADLIDAIRLDEKVKAVVFRVNSPGGSVLASSKIKGAIDRLRAVKPVVASYGDYAASGGYWVSCSCSPIFSNATTLTGSIGVFSMIPDVSATASDLLHVGIETIGSHAHSDMYSLMRPLDNAELDYMQKSVEDIYDRFVGLVAEGRSMETASVDSIAQGRVWTGADALGIRLVDHIGTLQDALAFAMDSAGGPLDLGGWNVVEYPAPLTAMEELTLLLSPGQTVPTILSGTPFEPLGEAFDGLRIKDPSTVYALLPYSIKIK